MAETTVAPEAKPRLDRKSLAIAALSALVLIVGVVVLVLGRGAASDASSDLRGTQRRLQQQQDRTRTATGCTADVERLRPGVVDAARALLSNSEQIVQQDAALVAASGAQQKAGVADNIDEYNNAVGRAVAAAETANLLLAQNRGLSIALIQKTAELDRAC
jgi:hypothetical protein